MKKKKRMSRAKQSALPSVKKDIKAFFREEEGRISKKDALTLGISMVALGTILAGPAAAAHSSYFENNADRGAHYSHDSGTGGGCSSGCGSSCSGPGCSGCDSCSTACSSGGCGSCTGCGGGSCGCSACAACACSSCAGAACGL